MNFKLLSKKGMGFFVWAGLFLSLLIFFTLLKFPHYRIEKYLEGSLKANAQLAGIVFQAQKTEIRFLWGLSLHLNEVTFSDLFQKKNLKLKKVIFKPSFVDLLTGSLGGGLFVEDPHLKARIRGRFNKKDFRAWGSIEKADLQKHPLISLFSPFEGSFQLNGTFDLEGPVNKIQAWKGQVSLDFMELRIPEQKAYGFQIPHLSIGEAFVKGRMINGVFQIRRFVLGAKEKPEDDLLAQVSGEIALDPVPLRSKADLVVEFGFSEKVKKSFSILETILKPALSSSGLYRYELRGFIGALSPVPRPA